MIDVETIVEHLTFTKHATFEERNDNKPRGRIKHFVERFSLLE